MESFEFVTVHSVGEALSTIGSLENPRMVAGATNVMNDIRAGKQKPATLVDVSHLDELRFIRMEDGVIRIGGLTRLVEIAESELLFEHAPALSMAARVFADPNTRNLATIAGNIASASPAADTAPALLVLGAKVRIQSKAGERSVPIEEFFKGVNRTVLEKNEMIVSVEFAPCKTSGFYKVGMRNAMAISVVTAAASVRLGADGEVADCKLALGSVAPTPVRAYTAEKLLIGTKPTPQAFERIAEAIRGDISPIDDVRATRAYRLGIAPTAVERAFELAAK